MTELEIRAAIAELEKRDLLDQATRIAKAHRVTIEEMVEVSNRDPLAVRARHAFWRELFGDPQVEWSVRRIAALAKCDRSTVAYALKPRDRRTA